MADAFFIRVTAFPGKWTRFDYHIFMMIRVT